jgi:hypothetical protein
MRFLLGVLLFLPVAACDDDPVGLCEDRGVLICSDPHTCCSRCRAAALGEACIAGEDCIFGGELSGESATCGADGVWHLMNLDLSANVRDMRSSDGASTDALSIDSSAD